VKGKVMEYRQLGASDRQILAPGSGSLFSVWGRADTREARRGVDICLEAGVNPSGPGDGAILPTCPRTPGRRQEGFARLNPPLGREGSPL
jgi:hypothetical protein